VIVRFLRFNAVGAMGIAVQIASLTLLVSALGVHYLPATAVAIELSVLHNFLWHERWTWRDRTGNAKDRMQNAECTMQSAGCTTQNAEGGARDAGRKGPQASRLVRLVMFHAGNGLVSMAGSLMLMPLLVGAIALHYVAANLLTIAATGLFNFLLGDRMIFRSALGGNADAEVQPLTAEHQCAPAPLGMQPLQWTGSLDVTGDLSDPERGSHRSRVATAGRGWNAACVHRPTAQSSRRRRLRKRAAALRFLRSARPRAALPEFVTRDSRRQTHGRLWHGGVAACRM